MNTTIDFKTAKTIENMSRKIDSMERAVSGFFNKMSDIAERKYGDPQVYLAAVGPARDLSAILLEEAPGILPCFDETDDTFGISKELPVAGCYNPKQVLELSGKRYLTGPVVFVRFNMEGEYVSLTMGDLHCIQEYLEQHSTALLSTTASQLCAQWSPSHARSKPAKPCSWPMSPARYKCDDRRLTMYLSPIAFLH